MTRGRRLDGWDDGDDSHPDFSDGDEAAARTSGLFAELDIDADGPEIRGEASEHPGDCLSAGWPSSLLADRLISPSVEYP